MRLLASVTKKEGLPDFLLALEKIAPNDLEIVSTGGTLDALVIAGLRVTPIETVTSIPEGMDGRVKTLSHRVAAGVLHRPYKDDAYLTLVHGVKFDMVIVNLYDFAATVADKKATHEQIVEKIDIGGPTLLRAAAKNHANCIPVCDPRQYPGLLRMFNEAGRLDPDVISLATREELSCAVFINTSAYDEAIKQYWQSYAFSNLPS